MGKQFIVLFIEKNKKKIKENLYDCAAIHVNAIKEQKERQMKFAIIRISIYDAFLHNVYSQIFRTVQNLLWRKFTNYIKV